MDEKNIGKIIINGREYGSIDEVPAELRSLITARGGNPVNVFVKRTVTFRVNGKEVNNPADMPEAVREALRDADGNGIPDIAERSLADAAPVSPDTAGDGSKITETVITTRRRASGPLLLTLAALAAAVAAFYVFGL